MAILTSARLTKSNILNQAHSNIYNLINNRDNVPLIAGLPTDHKYVHVREPNFSSYNFNGFPWIVVPRFTTAQKAHSMDRTKSEVVLKTTIVVYTQDKSSDSSGNASGSEQANIITDYIITALNSSANRATLRSYGLAPFDILETSSDIGEVDGKQVFITEIPIMFTPVLKTA